MVVASTDLTVGSNRFVFGVLDSESAPVRVPEAKVTFVYLETAPPQAGPVAMARFVEWPAGRAGVYVADVSYDLPGRWGVIVAATDPDGTLYVGQAGFVVKEQSSSPGIGQPVPATRNKTARDVSDLAEITSSEVPDPDLYEITVAEAIASGLPTVVTFSTPAYCQTATCGPQVEVVASVKEGYAGRANFVHIEVYDNPREIRGDLSRARVSPHMEEWGILTEPFTFVLDRQGLVAHKFEGFVPEGDLGAAVADVLDR